MRKTWIRLNVSGMLMIEGTSRVLNVMIMYKLEAILCYDTFFKGLVISEMLDSHIFLISYQS